MAPSSRQTTDTARNGSVTELDVEATPIGEDEIQAICTNIANLEEQSVIVQSLLAIYLTNATELA